MVSAWKRKRTSSPRALRAFATASATRTSRRLWMWPEGLMPVTTTCGPGPSPSATLSAQRGTGMRVSAMLRSTRGSLRETRRRTLRGLARRLDVDDLVLRGAARGRDRNLLADLAPENRAADRRGVGEVAAPRIRLVGAHDLEGALLAAVDHPQRDARPEVHRVGADLGGVHHLGVADAALDLADPARQKPLLGLGVVVLGVLGDVPELPRLPDAVGNLLAPDVREVRELLLKLLQTRGGDQFLVLVRHEPRDYTGGPEGCQRETRGVPAAPATPPRGPPPV